MDIYVGSIPFKWKEKHLIEMFDAFGEVISAKIIMDKITRQSKGFAFITMADEEKALLAISALNDTEHEGRKIVVTVSVPNVDIKKPQRSSPFNKDKSPRDKKKPMEFKSANHKKSVPPWMRKEY